MKFYLMLVVVMPSLVFANGFDSVYSCTGAPDQKIDITVIEHNDGSGEITSSFAVLKDQYGPTKLPNLEKKPMLSSDPETYSKTRWSAWDFELIGIFMVDEPTRKFSAALIWQSTSYKNLNCEIL